MYRLELYGISLGHGQGKKETKCVHVHLDVDEEDLLLLDCAQLWGIRIEKTDINEFPRDEL